MNLTAQFRRFSTVSPAVSFLRRLRLMVYKSGKECQPNVQKVLTGHFHSDTGQKT